MKYDSYTMPKSSAQKAGMKTIQAQMDNIGAKIIKEDHVYQRKNGLNLRIRMVYPNTLAPKKPFPLVVHIQGSGWFEQDLNGTIMEFKDLVTAGYAMAIVEYAPLPDAIFPSQVEDAKMAGRYLADHAKELEIDMDRMLLCGDSSGGHTALMAWSTWNKPLLDASEGPLPEIKGCIDLYGVYDLLTIPDKESAVDHRKPTSPDSLLIGGFLPEDYPEKAEKASVPYYLKQADALVPLLIIHGNKDRLVPFEQSVELFEFCKEKQLQADFYCVDGADHGGPTFFTDEVIQIMLDFTDKCLK